MPHEKAVYVDFDSLIRPTKFGWPGALETSHEPKPGALQWLVSLTQDETQRVYIYSSKNKYRDDEKIAALYYWLLSDGFAKPLDIQLGFRFVDCPFTSTKAPQSIVAFEFRF